MLTVDDLKHWKKKNKTPTASPFEGIVKNIKTMSEFIKEFEKLYSSQNIQVIENNQSPEEAMKLYFSLLEEGKNNGFLPIIVEADDILLEKLELDLEDEDLDFSEEGLTTLRQNILAEAQEIDHHSLYKDEKKELGETLEPIDFEEPESDEVLFSSLLSFEDETKLKENLIIIKLPINNKPYEALAWLPMGGFNDCPMPSQMVAMAKHWFEKYGAIPAVITNDVVEFFVPQVIEDKETLIDLGMEQFFFCIDIVEQGVGSVEELIKTLYKSKQWYFWWD